MIFSMSRRYVQQTNKKRKMTEQNKINTSSASRYIRTQKGAWEAVWGTSSTQQPTTTTSPDNSGSFPGKHQENSRKIPTPRRRVLETKTVYFWLFSCMSPPFAKKYNKTNKSERKIRGVPTQQPEHTPLSPWTTKHFYTPPLPPVTRQQMPLPSSLILVELQELKRGAGACISRSF